MTQEILPGWDEQTCQFDREVIRKYLVRNKEGQRQFLFFAQAKGWTVKECENQTGITQSAISRWLPANPDINLPRIYTGARQQERMAIAQGFRASGMSVDGYARKIGLNQGTLYKILVDFPENSTHEGDTMSTADNHADNENVTNAQAGVVNPEASESGAEEARRRAEKEAKIYDLQQQIDDLKRQKLELERDSGYYRESREWAERRKFSIIGALKPHHIPYTPNRELYFALECAAKKLAETGDFNDAADFIHRVFSCDTKKLLRDFLANVVAYSARQNGRPDPVKEFGLNK